MDSTQFKAARHALGLSLGELSHILNTAERAIRKWEGDVDASTSRSPNPVAARVMTWMLDGYRPPEWPEGK